MEVGLRHRHTRGGSEAALRVVVVGASLGGLYALQVLLGGLPSDFEWPITIVQHRHKDSDGTLRAVLQQASALPVYEAEDKCALERGVYLAPADYHVLMERGALALSIDAPVEYARPAIDVLFESAADSYGAQTIGIILTGASSDGARGLAAIKRHGGLAIVQDPATAECRVMPEAALALAAADHVLPLHEIARLLVQLYQRTAKAYS